MRRIVLLFLTFVSPSAVAQPTCDELVPKLMDVGGINQALAALPEGMRVVTSAQLEEPGSMPVEMKRELESVMLHAFNMERLTRNVKTKLAESCDAATFAAVLDQMQSPLGQKMLQLEIRQVSSPEEGKRMQRYIASFPMQSPRETRMRLIRRLMDATKAAETFNDQVVNITSLMLETGLNSAPSKEQLAAFRAELLPRVQQFMEAQMYYIYRSVSDEELEQYIAIQSSKPEQRFTNDEAKALLYAFSEETVELATKIRKVALEQKAKHGPQ